MANGAMSTFRRLGFALAIPIFATALAGRAQTMLSGHFTDPATAAERLNSGGYAGLIVDAPPRYARRWNTPCAPCSPPDSTVSSCSAECPLC
jgi:hypothetical protein